MKSGALRERGYRQEPDSLLETGGDVLFWGEGELTDRVGAIDFARSHTFSSFKVNLHQHKPIPMDLIKKYFMSSQVP